MKRKTNYYLVRCKLGHVRLGHYIEKDIPIYAKDKKEAARIARNKGRVKHDDKHAVRSIKELTYEEYKECVKVYEADNFFKVNCVQEQRRLCLDIYDEVKLEEKLPSYRKTRMRSGLVERSKLKEITKYKDYLNYE